MKPRDTCKKHYWTCIGTGEGHDKGGHEAKKVFQGKACALDVRCNGILGTCGHKEGDLDGL
jgi:hypothetical protein